MKLTFGRVLAWAVAALGVAIIIAPLVRHGDLPIALHHLIHAVAVGGGAALALALMQAPRDRNEHSAWLLPATLAPIAMMFLMWPSFYESLDANPVIHIADHAALFVTGWLTVAAGQRYRSGTGAALGVIAVLMALTAAGGFGSYLG